MEGLSWTPGSLFVSVGVTAEDTGRLRSVKNKESFSSLITVVNVSYNLGFELNMHALTLEDKNKELKVLLEWNPAT